MKSFCSELNMAVQSPTSPQLYTNSGKNRKRAGPEAKRPAQGRPFSERLQENQCAGGIGVLYAGRNIGCGPPVQQLIGATLAISAINRLSAQMHTGHTLLFGRFPNFSNAALNSRCLNRVRARLPSSTGDLVYNLFLGALESNANGNGWEELPEEAFARAAEKRSVLAGSGGYTSLPAIRVLWAAVDD